MPALTVAPKKTITKVILRSNSNNFLLAYCTLTKTNKVTNSSALCSSDLGPPV